MPASLLEVTGIHTSLTVPQNSSFYTSIETQNAGGSVVKDFLAAFGSYNPATGEFTMYWGYVATNVTINSGSDVNDVTCEAISTGTWDVLGAIGTYDAGAGTFTIESAIVAEDLLTVT